MKNGAKNSLLMWFCSIWMLVLDKLKPDGKAFSSD